MQPQPQSLDVAASFAEIRKRFAEDPKRDTFNALVCGEMGTGKTYLAKTCRKPLLADFFDPGGYNTLRTEIDQGEVLPRNFSPDDPFKPWAFRDWANSWSTVEKLAPYLGTYMLDSSTLWAEAILNYFLAQRGQAGKVPSGKADYLPQKNEIRNWMSKILSLPCDVIVTGHLEPEQDGVTGKVTYRYATTGKGTFLIPAMFDEVYVMISEETSKGITRNILTAATGRYAARSRLAQNGKIEPYMPPDIKNILKLAGYPTEDKPLFIEQPA